MKEYNKKILILLETPFFTWSLKHHNFLISFESHFSESFIAMPPTY